MAKPSVSNIIADVIKVSYSLPRKLYILRQVAYLLAVLPIRELAVISRLANVSPAFIKSHLPALLPNGYTLEEPKEGSRINPDKAVLNAFLSLYQQDDSVIDDAIARLEGNPMQNLIRVGKLMGAIEHAKTVTLTSQHVEEIQDLLTSEAVKAE